MSRIVLNRAALAQLAGHDELVEVCDDAGQVVGHFVPIMRPRDEADREPRITEEEMDRRERAGGGRCLKSILADLENRA